MTADTSIVNNGLQESDNHLSKRKRLAEKVPLSPPPQRRGNTPGASSSSSSFSTNSTTSSTNYFPAANFGQRSQAQYGLSSSGDMGGHVIQYYGVPPQSRNVFQHYSPNSVPSTSSYSPYRNNNTVNIYHEAPLSSQQPYGNGGSGGGDLQKPSLPGIGTLLNGIGIGMPAVVRTPDQDAIQGKKNNAGLFQVFGPQTPNSSTSYYNVLPTPNSLPPVNQMAKDGSESNQSQIQGQNREDMISSSTLLASQVLTQMPNHQNSYAYLRSLDAGKVSGCGSDGSNLVHSYSGYIGGPEQPQNYPLNSTPLQTQPQREHEQEQKLGPPVNITPPGPEYSKQQQLNRSNYQGVGDYNNQHQHYAPADSEKSHHHFKPPTSGSNDASHLGNDQPYYVRYMHPPFNQIYYQPTVLQSQMYASQPSLGVHTDNSYEDHGHKPVFHADHPQQFNVSADAVTTHDEPQMVGVNHGQHHNFSFCRPIAQSSHISVRRDIKRRTKTGCLTCRKRRIKCDENHPTCRNCEKSKRICLGYDPVFKLFSSKTSQKKSSSASSTAEDADSNSGVETPSDSSSRSKPDRSSGNSGNVSPLTDNKSTCGRIKVESLLAAAVPLEKAQQPNSKEWTWPELYQCYQDNIAIVLDQMFGSRKFKTILVLRGSHVGETNENLTVLEVIRQIIAHLNSTWSLESLRVDESKVHKMEELRITDNYKLIRCVAQFVRFTKNTEYLNVGDNYTDAVLYERIRMLHHIIFLMDYGGPKSQSLASMLSRRDLCDDNWTESVDTLVAKCLESGEVDLVWKLIAFILNNGNLVKEKHVNRLVSGLVDNVSNCIPSPKTTTSSSPSSTQSSPEYGDDHLSKRQPTMKGLMDPALQTVMLLGLYYCSIRNQYSIARRVQYLLEEYSHKNGLMNALVNVILSA